MTEKECIEQTQKHINSVAAKILVLVNKLRARAVTHDLSKLVPPELPIFVEFTPKLSGSTYGSEEYKGFLEAMKPALDHHYAENRHHPEHFGGDISKMNLVDLVEMLCDWVAASERHADGDPLRSIDLNAKRFNLDPQVAAILRNTVAALKESVIYEPGKLVVTTLNEDGEIVELPRSDDYVETDATHVTFDEKAKVAHHAWSGETEDKEE